MICGSPESVDAFRGTAGTAQRGERREVLRAVGLSSVLMRVSGWIVL
jgi:hypothetical protein